MTKKIKVMVIVAAMLAIFNATAFAIEAGAKTVNINDNGNLTSYTTLAATVEDLFEMKDITLSKADEIDKDLDTTLTDNMTIKISRSTPVILSIDGAPKMISTTEKTVGELISSIDGFELYSLETPSDNAKIISDMVIELSSRREIVTTKTEKIPFKVEYKNTSELEEGQERVIQKGKDGELEKKVNEVYEGSKLLSSTELESKTILEPVTEIIEKGVKNMIETPNGFVRYSSALTVEATGYTPFDPGCNGITATGTVARPGVIAVDPSVIPLGTKVYVPGYGLATAEDVGGAIKGNKIDLCYNTVPEALTWGRQSVTMYILE